MWFVFCKQDTVLAKFITDSVVHTMITWWVTVLWETSGVKKKTQGWAYRCAWQLGGGRRQQGWHSIVTDELIQKVYQVMCEKCLIISDFSDQSPPTSRNNLFWTDTERIVINEELMDGVNNWLDTLAASFFDKGLQNMMQQYNKFPEFGWWLYETVSSYVCKFYMCNKNFSHNWFLFLVRGWFWNSPCI